ncbi:MAG: thioredoxin domain-containing protein [Bauldia sp.]|nr:thioredoxin domain-containing protein [Bauldia sp.]
MSQNLLRHEASPYLLQHKDNPVHWRPWGPSAFAEARRDNKPILLSVGYAACHWCHVMAHESFEDPDTAAVMNRLFVNIKVDREERPDIDQIYMTALHALGEQGGWPLTMFLTPDGEPIWGGTYFPPTARYGRPAFVAILEEVARLFREEPDKVERNRTHLMDTLRRTRPTDAIAADTNLLDQAAERLLTYMDLERGGIRGAPKFPQASLLEMLWRAGLRTGYPRFRDAVLTTLRHLCQGGIYDHLGGGFARYSVDDRWLVPHFEKMLYDNAQLIGLLTEAFLATGEPLFRTRIEETVAWLLRDMCLPGGAFAASVDADSEGHEGRYYVWRPSDLVELLGPDDATFFAEVYDVTPAGNFEGASILNRLTHLQPLDAVAEARLARLRVTLLDARHRRVPPATDDKTLTDWNGLTIAALARAGDALARPDWIDRAAEAYAFITTTMSRDSRLAHAHRAGVTVYPGLATDYAALIKATLALHDATHDEAWIARAIHHTAVLRRHYWDTTHPGYFLSADDADTLIVRPRSATDEATPSADAVMAANLVRLWRLTGEDSYRADADAIIAHARFADNLFTTTAMLSALDFRLGVVDVVIVTPDGQSPAALVAVVRAAPNTNLVLAIHRGEVRVDPGHPAHGKSSLDGKPTAYVCRGDTCSPPTTSPVELAALLSPTPPGPLPIDAVRP